MSIYQKIDVLTFSGTERLVVRRIASAIPWAYQGFKNNDNNEQLKFSKNCSKHVYM